MPIIEDIYKLSTQADVSSLQAAQTVIRQQFTRTVKTLRTLGTRIKTSAKAFKQFAKAKPTLAGVAMAMKRVSGGAVKLTGRLVRLGARGFGGLVKGGAKAMGALRGFAGGIMGLFGPIMQIGGALFNAIGGMEGLKGAMGMTEDAAEGAASGMDDANESMAESTDNMNAMGDAAEQNESKIGGMLGAFGDVGAGFVQRQGKEGQAVQKTNAETVQSLKATDEAAETSAETATRLGEAWQKVAGIFQKALAKVLLPLVGALADMLEDPRFIEFVTLLADDLAGALEIVVGWLIDEAIPALLDFLEEVNEAGGPIEFFKKKWEELKTTVMKIVAIILGSIILFSNSVKRKFTEIGVSINNVWTFIKDQAILAWEAIGEVATRIWQGIRDTVLVGVGAIVDALNSLINGYNDIGGKFGLPKLPEVKKPTRLAAGAIVNKPLHAIVGDNPFSPEVVAPLSDLVGILRQALGGESGGGITIGQLIVQVPPGTTNPQATGEAFGKGIMTGMRNNMTKFRQAGARLPV